MLRRWGGETNVWFVNRVDRVIWQRKEIRRSADVLRVRSEGKDEGLALETAALEPLYGRQITLSPLLKKQTFIL